MRSKRSSGGVSSRFNARERLKTLGLICGKRCGRHCFIALIERIADENDFHQRHHYRLISVHNSSLFVLERMLLKIEEDQDCTARLIPEKSAAMSLSQPIGIIGGSGLYQLAAFTAQKEVRLETPFGAPSDAYIQGQLAGHDVVFLPRHARGHKLLPSEIPHRANIHGIQAARREMDHQHQRGRLAPARLRAGRSCAARPVLRPDQGPRRRHVLRRRHRRARRVRRSDQHRIAGRPSRLGPGRRREGAQGRDLREHRRARSFPPARNRRPIAPPATPSSA